MKAIMYHYVRPAPDNLPYFRYLHVEDFARQLDWLAHNFGFVTREQFDHACKSGEAPMGAVLTFDDGLSDHYNHVFPLLKERGLFGFFYICTSPYRTGKLLDVHRIHLILGGLGGQVALQRLSEQLTDGMLADAHVREFREATYSRQDNDRATNIFKRTLNYFISYEYREDVLNRLFNEQFGPQDALAPRFYLSAEQIREMDAAGMVMGSHGVNHYVFSKLAVEDQRREITTSFAQLSGILGHPVTSFCYPYGGRHSFTADTPLLLDEVGSQFAFDVAPRDVTSEDLLEARQALPRYDCNMFPHGRASLGRHRAPQAA